MSNFETVTDLYTNDVSADADRETTNTVQSAAATTPLTMAGNSGDTIFDDPVPICVP